MENKKINKKYLILLLGGLLSLIFISGMVFAECWTAYSGVQYCTPCSKIEYQANGCCTPSCIFPEVCLMDSLRTEETSTGGSYTRYTFSNPVCGIQLLSCTARTFGPGTDFFSDIMVCDMNTEFALKFGPYGQPISSTQEQCECCSNQYSAGFGQVFELNQETGACELQYWDETKQYPKYECKECADGFEGVSDNCAVENQNNCCHGECYNSNTELCCGSDDCEPKVFIKVNEYTHCCETSEGYVLTTYAKWE